MSTLSEIIAQGLFRFSFNDMICEETTAFPQTWDTFTASGSAWEDVEFGPTYEQINCGESLMTWNDYTCESAQELGQGVIYFPDTLNITNECS